MMNHLRLDNAEKRLGNCIVPAVTLTAHTLNKAMFVKHLPKIVASILNAAIRMDNQASFRLAALNCPMQCSLDHLTTQRAAQGPANDHSRKQIQKDSQVQPTTFSGDIGNIRNPHRVRCAGLKIALQKVCCNWIRMLRVGCRAVFAPNYRSEPNCLHSAGNSILTDLKTIIMQFIGDLRTAIAALMLLVNHLYMSI